MKRLFGCSLLLIALWSASGHSQSLYWSSSYSTIQRFDTANRQDCEWRYEVDGEFLLLSHRMDRTSDGSGAMDLSMGVPGLGNRAGLWRNQWVRVGVVTMGDTPRETFHEAYVEYEDEILIRDLDPRGFLDRMQAAGSLVFNFPGGESVSFLRERIVEVGYQMAECFESIGGRLSDPQPLVQQQPAPQPAPQQPPPKPLPGNDPAPTAGAGITTGYYTGGRGGVDVAIAFDACGANWCAEAETGVSAWTATCGAPTVSGGSYIFTCPMTGRRHSDGASYTGTATLITDGATMTYRYRVQYGKGPVYADEFELLNIAG